MGPHFDDKTTLIIEAFPHLPYGHDELHALLSRKWGEAAIERPNLPLQWGVSPEKTSTTGYYTPPLS